MSADKYPCIFSRQMAAIVYRAFTWRENMHGYLSADIICSEK